MSQESSKVTAISVSIIIVFVVVALGLSLIPSPSSPTSPAIVEARIKPVVTLSDLRGSTTSEKAAPQEAVAAAPKSAKDLYNGVCAACHATGAAAAPIVGNKDQWQARAAMGLDALLTSSINGKGAMPPKGGSAYSDEELKKIISFMLAESGL
ncbi:MAG: c-type cytochrome [Gammaproteobacteria bacterium]|nr:c-type cytochrome [Gammaproteobacteria bacterium]